MEIIRKGLISLWGRFQFLFVWTWFLRKRNIDSKRLFQTLNENQKVWMKITWILFFRYVRISRSTIT